jgi:hypothetical protein
MDKINQIPPENKDYMCALFCGIVLGCDFSCDYLCLLPLTYYGSFVSALQTSGPHSYVSNYVWCG